MFDRILIVLRFFGVFKLFRILRSPQITILAYHGFSVKDEHTFSPSLFMTRETFSKRMRSIKEQGYDLISLNDAVTHLQNHSLKKDMLVITLDDGWFGALDSAVPILLQEKIPATFYVTTYYVEKRIAVFNVFIRYLILKTGNPSIKIGHIYSEIEDNLSLSTAALREQAIQKLSEFGESLNAVDRHDFSRVVAENLGFDFESLHRKRFMQLLNEEEILKISNLGFDIQLHSHRHSGVKMLDNHDLTNSEIEDNRSSLKNVSGSPLVHYCYPSGEYHDRQLPWLRDLGIASATTCQYGVNYIGTNPLQLNRILDGEHISQIRLEADLCGIGLFTYKCKSTLKGILSIFKN